MIAAILLLAQAQTYKTEKAIPYRTESVQTATMRQRCRLDIYYPVGKKDFSTVIWFHGGGLTGGDRDIPKELMDKGIAVIAPNYRLSPADKAPSYIEDAAAAAAWTFNNIEKFGGSTKNIFVSGHSAGGYLASMITLDKRWLAKYKIDPDQFAGLIPFSGQAITHYTIRAERGIKDTTAVIDDLAPLNHVRKDSPPVLLLTADRNKELLGRYEEVAYFWRMFQLVNHPDCQILEMQGYDHGGMPYPGFPIMVGWMNKHRR